MGLGEVDIVDERVSLAVRVGQFLIENKFVVANVEGQGLANATQITNHTGIGLLKPDTADSIFAALVGNDGPREFFGILWFQNESLEASLKKRWVLQVYNVPKNRGKARAIAKRLANQFAVDISVRLVQDDPEYENLARK
jgi:hypothetical protein